MIKHKAAMVRNTALNCCVQLEMNVSIVAPPNQIANEVIQQQLVASTRANIPPKNVFL